MLVSLSHRTYLPVFARGLAVDLGVVGQVPVPIHKLATVAGRPPRQSAQARDAEQAGEAAAGADGPLVVISVTLGRSDGLLRIGWVLVGTQDGRHVKWAHLTAVVILW